MAGPWLAAWIPAIIASVGAVSSARTASNEAKGAAQANEYNAQVSRLQSEERRNIAMTQEDMQRARARQAIGEQVASSAEAGAGLNGDLLRESFLNMELDTRAIRYQAAQDSESLNREADLQMGYARNNRQKGKNAVKAGYLSAAGSLAGGYNNYTKAGKNGKVS